MTFRTAVGTLASAEMKFRELHVESYCTFLLMRFSEIGIM